MRAVDHAGRAAAARQPWRRTCAVTAALALAVGTAVLAERESIAADTAAADRPLPQGMPFRPPPQPMHVTIESMVAVSLRVEKNVSILLSDGATRTTTKYTFTKLRIRDHLNMTQRGDGYRVILDVPDEGSLGGFDSTGRPEKTVMWGNISNVCVRVLVKVCGVQGLLDSFGSIIPLTAGAEDFEGDIYAIRATDQNAGLNSADNPVHLPGTITVISP